MTIIQYFRILYAGYRLQMSDSQARRLAYAEATAPLPF